ncbi:MAG: hypothetical protein HDR82_09345 [Bacteroides sp.]|nr:hypothetical protein [Bacteroides sp.]
MKKLLSILGAIGLLFFVNSCSNEKQKSQKWEYKTLIAWGELSSQFDYFSNNSIPVPEVELNKLGEEGWELVSVYTRIQTVHPNFGNDKYVTGLQPNTRTHGVFYVFKRLKQHNGDSSDTKNSKYVVIVGQDEEVEECDSVPVPEALAN